MHQDPAGNPLLIRPTAVCTVAELRTRLRALLQTELFQRDVHALSKEEKLAHAYALFRKVAETAQLRADDVVGVERMLAVLEAPVMVACIALSPFLASHFNLCLGTIMDLGGVIRDDLRDYIDELVTMKTLGIYMVTELEHGNNAMSIETEATYDAEAREFIINTPSDGARKFMPYVSAPGEPKLAVVMARLIVRGENCGVHPFIVRCRREGGALVPGVEVSDLSTIDMHTPDPVDHSITRFINVRVPHRAFLGGRYNEVTLDGRFITTLPNRRATFMHSLKRIEWGKFVLVGALMSGVKSSVCIATRFSVNRKMVRDRAGGTSPISELTTQKTELAEAYVLVSAASSLYEVLKARCLDESCDADTHAVAAGVVKSACVELFRVAVQKCIARCGAQGKMVRNLMVRMLTLIDQTSTAEGDTLPVMSKLAKDMLSQRGYIPPEKEYPEALFTPEGMLAVFRSRERFIYDELRNRLAADEDTVGAWNRNLRLAVKLASALGARLAMEALSDKPEVLMAFGLMQMVEDGAWLAAKGLLTPQELSQALVMLEDALLSVFATRVLKAEEEFDVADVVNLTPIGKGDLSSAWASMS